MPTNRDPLNRVTLPDLFEVWKCDHSTGSFEQLAGPDSEENMRGAWEAFGKHSELSRQKLLLVRVRRTSIAANFNTDEIGKPARDFSKKDN